MLIEHPSLSQEVLAHIERLGGQPGAPLTELVADLPEGISMAPAITQFLSIQWPDPANTLYHADENGPLFWAQNIRFHRAQYCDRIDFGFSDRAEKELVRFCHARCRYFIMLDLLDPDPLDPRVYHVSSGSFTSTLANGIALSVFLSQLRVMAVGQPVR